MKRIFTAFMIALTVVLTGCKKEELPTNQIYVFYQNGCSHCVDAHNYISRYYSKYNVRELNIRDGDNFGYMQRYARKFKVPSQSLGTPFIVMGDNYIMGWGAEQIKNFNRYIKDFKPKAKAFK